MADGEGRLREKTGQGRKERKGSKEAGKSEGSAGGRETGKEQKERKGRAKKKGESMRRRERSTEGGRK